MRLSVILSTYNQPRWLEKVLWGYTVQSRRDFELVIADDGSGPETAEVIERFRRSGELRLLHVRHEDAGFRKTEILNRAILESSGDYLIFSDGDCIPRDDFVDVHARLARPRRFVSGTVLMLPPDLSERITPEDIISGRFAEAGWLRRHGFHAGRRITRLVRGGWVGTIADTLSSASRHFAGGNASVARAALFEVNGFDHEMKYGYEDWSLGERLRNAGYGATQARNRAVLFHLDHPRSYKSADEMARNKVVYERIRASGETRARVGLAEMAERVAAERAAATAGSR